MLFYNRGNTAANLTTAICSFLQLTSEGFSLLKFKVALFLLKAVQLAVEMDPVPGMAQLPMFCAVGRAQPFMCSSVS